jgi:hypothetical protein
LNTSKFGVMSSPYCSGTERRGGMMKSMRQQDSLFLSRNFDKSAPLSRHQQERCCNHHFFAVPRLGAGTPFLL